jgi:uncharacterized protein YqiB (DUF1249 family)
MASGLDSIDSRVKNKVNELVRLVNTYEKDIADLKRLIHAQLVIDESRCSMLEQTVREQDARIQALETTLGALRDVLSK